MLVKTPAIVYAAKSTQDRKDSIGTQLAEAREMAEANGWEVVAELQDEGFSAYSGNRGPAWQRAQEMAVEAAARFGTTCMLVAQAHDRFARGAGDRPGAPESLGEVWHRMRRADVWLRTVEDDEELRDESSVAAIGRRAHIDSLRKSKSVKKGMARRSAKGLHNARPPLGYINDGGYLVVEPREAVLVRRIFSDWCSGHSQRGIAQMLNQQGVRTQRGSPWFQGTLGKVLRNRVYVGVHSPADNLEAMCPCGHEAIIDRAQFERAQELMGKSAVGRRTRAGHLFLKGAGCRLYCGLCHAPLCPRTDNRRDYEVYTCLSKLSHGKGACEMPVVQRRFVEEALLGELVERVDIEAMTAVHASQAGIQVAAISEQLTEAEHSEMLAQQRLTRVKRAFQDGHLDATDWSEQRQELQGELDGARAQTEHLRDRERQLQAALSARVDVDAEVTRFLDEISDLAALPRDQETLVALRAAFQRYWKGFTVYPPGHVPEPMLAKLPRDAARRAWAIEPIVRSDDKIVLEMPAPIHAYDENKGWPLALPSADAVLCSWLSAPRVLEPSA